MRLVDLDPGWILRDGRRIGFHFLSPVQPMAGSPHYRQSCFIVLMPRSEQLDLFEAIFGVPYHVQGCKPTFAWSVEGGIENATFETMTVKPSLNGSPGGLWHGNITNGAIV